MLAACSEEIQSAQTQSELNYQNYLYGGKELDRKFGINAYDFTGRYYDLTDNRFWSMDPMAEKYYSISPYAYCANNPLRFIDPTGKWIAGTDGKPVSYMNGKWSSNASADIINVGYSMMLTQSGTEHLNEMLSHNSQKIKIKVDSERLKVGDGWDLGFTKNSTTIDKAGKLKVVESIITIHAGSIAGAIVGNNELSGYTYDEALGIVAGHEKGHTEVENAGKSYENNKAINEVNDVEARPMEIEEEIKFELNEIKNL